MHRPHTTDEKNTLKIQVINSITALRNIAALYKYTTMNIILSNIQTDLLDLIDRDGKV